MRSLHTKALMILQAALILAFIDVISAFAFYHPDFPVQVCLGPIYDDAEDHNVAPDGCGGCFIVWKQQIEYENLPLYRTHIFLQHIDAAGEPQFGNRGVIVQLDVNDYYGIPEVVADGQGGAFVFFSDGPYDGGNNFRINRIDNLGEILWTRPVGSVNMYSNLVTWRVFPDGYGGCFVVHTSFNNWNYVKRINSNGDELWWRINAPNGDFSGYFDAVLDGTGGLVVVWSGGDSYARNIYMQRYTKNGTKLLGSSLGVCEANYSQTDPHIVRDGRNGFIIVWKDSRPTNEGIYAQRVDTTGTLKWTPSYTSVPVHVGDWHIDSPRIVADSEGGAWIGWKDENQGLMAQKISYNGSLLWDDGGKSLCPSADYDMIQQSPECVYFVVDDHVLTINTDGKKGTQTDFTSVYLPRFIGDGAGCLIAVYNDGSSSGDGKYAQHIRPGGALGSMGPSAPSVYDVPDDQGGWVNIQFHRAARDYPVDCGYPITSYGIWRSVNNPALSTAVSSQARSNEVNREYVFGSIPAVKIGSELFVFVEGEKEKGVLKSPMGEPDDPYPHFPAGTWQFIGNVPAVQQYEYNALAATNGDASPNNPLVTDFVVTAHTSTPSVWYISDVGSGSSTDDIAPQIPQGVSAQLVDGSLSIEWTPNPDNDLDHYAVYRGSSQDFDPDEASCIGYSIEAEFIDSGWSEEGNYYYKVTALDHSQNESNSALLPPVQGTSDVPGTRNSKLELHQNYPNPFNPATTISFTLPNTMKVSLKIYDVAGRLVKTLADGELGAGMQQYSWDGTSTNGNSVASGAYFYRLQTGSTLLTKKMILIK